MSSPTGVRDDSGNLEFIGAVRDVTAAKIGQRKLKEDEAELRQLINFVPEHVLVMDADGNRLYENQAMWEYFGTSLDGIQAKDFYRKFVYPDDVASGALEERERAVSRGAHGKESCGYGAKMVSTVGF